MTTCRDIEPLLAERALGELAPADEARLQTHLGGCPGCRRELAAYAQALDLARLPVDARYDHGLAGLDASTLAAWRRLRRRRAAALVLGGAFAAAAAAALLALSPALVGHRRVPGAATSVATRPEPDVDSALAAADALEGGGTAASADDGTTDDPAEDVVLAAFDAALE